MKTLKETKEILSKEIKTRIMPKSGYPYIPASAIRERLNEAFNCLWDSEILQVKILYEDTVLLQLRFVGKVTEGSIIKEGFGSAPIHKFTFGEKEGKPTNIGDAHGNAHMDALKNCCKQMGVGNKEMDVYFDKKTQTYIRHSDVPQTVSQTPTKTTKPTKPVKTTKPVKPVKTTKPVKPVKPVKTIKPAGDSDGEPIKSNENIPICLGGGTFGVDNDNFDLCDSCADYAACCKAFFENNK